jgi:uncharacterized membrane protein (DUF485 family)
VSVAHEPPAGAEAEAEARAGAGRVHAMLASAEFRALVRRRWAVSLSLTAALFAAYYGFVLLIALRPALLARRIGAATTLGIPIAAGVIVAACALTVVYVLWANRVYDAAVARLRARLGR